MAIYHITDTVREVEEIQYVSDDLRVRQVAARYYIDPVTMNVQLVWDYLTSYYVFDDTWSEQFPDGWICKFEDQ